MFSLKVIDTDQFLDLPASTQALYFHLGIRADDDGFVGAPKKIMRMCNASGDDLKLLVAKQLIIVFETGIAVVKHWHIHNYIQNDRYQETMYKDEKERLTLVDTVYELTDEDTKCIQDVSKTDTQVRLGEVRKGKVREEREEGKAGQSSAPSRKPKRVPDLVLGECENVRLTTAEKDRLVGEHGEEVVNEAIDFLSMWKEEKGKRVKNDNLALRRWTIDAVYERKVKKGSAIDIDAIVQEAAGGR